MTVPHQTGRARMPSTTVPSETNGCAASVLARAARATRHARAKEILVTRAARATRHARATAVSPRPRLGLEKRCDVIFWGVSYFG